MNMIDSCNECHEAPNSFNFLSNDPVLGVRGGEEEEEEEEQAIHSQERRKHFG